MLFQAGNYLIRILEIFSLDFDLKKRMSYLFNQLIFVWVIFIRLEKLPFLILHLVDI